MNHNGMTCNAASPCFGLCRPGDRCRRQQSSSVLTLFDPLPFPPTHQHDVPNSELFATFTSCLSPLDPSPPLQFDIAPAFQQPSSEFPAFEYDSLPDELYYLRHRDSVVSVSGSSISGPPSPVELPTPGPVKVSSAEDADEEEAPWNLVTYHIPWGSSYHGYKAGTLPGPEGPCIFLRSPTPSKKQRTTQACETCRERKAKCSGDRPSCLRCQGRGLACVYAPVAATESLTDSPRTASSRPKPKRAPILRKGSLPERETHPARGITRRMSLGSGDAPQADPEHNRDQVLSRKASCWSPNLSILPFPSPDEQSPIDCLEPPFLSLGSSPLPTESLDGYGEYRFPAPPYVLDKVEEITQSPRRESLRLLNIENPTVFQNSGFPAHISGVPDEKQIHPQAVTAEPLYAAVAHSLSSLSSASYSASSAPCDAYFQPPYIASGSPFLDPAFASLAFLDGHTFALSR